VIEVLKFRKKAAAGHKYVVNAAGVSGAAHFKNLLAADSSWATRDSVTLILDETLPAEVILSVADPNMIRKRS
jgi:hypothetical protein